MKCKERAIKGKLWIILDYEEERMSAEAILTRDVLKQVDIARDRSRCENEILKHKRKRKMRKKGKKTRRRDLKRKKVRRKWANGSTKL